MVRSAHESFVDDEEEEEEEGKEEEKDRAHPRWCSKRQARLSFWCYP